MTDLKSMNIPELERFLGELGEPRFRAKQIFRWMHRGASSFEEMTDLSKGLREKLKERCCLTVPTVERKQVSKEDGTIKYLWRLGDGNCIETVLMRLFTERLRFALVADLRMFFCADLMLAIAVC